MGRTLTLPMPRRVGDLTGWDTLVAPGVLQQKDGSFLACLRFQWLDHASDLPIAQMVQARQLNSLLRRLGAGWSLMTEMRRSPATTYPAQTFPDPVSRCLDAERRAWCTTPGHRYAMTATLTLTYRRPPLVMPGWKSLLFTHLPQTDLDAETLAWFTEEVDRFLGLFRAHCAAAAWLLEEDLLRYLKSTISVHDHPVGVPDIPIALDTYLSDTDLTLERRWPSLLRWPRLGTQWIRCVGVKRYPQATYPGVFDALASLSLPYRCTSRFLPLAQDKAISTIKRIRSAHYGLRQGLYAAMRQQRTGEEAALQDQAALDYEQEASEAQAAVRHGDVSQGYLTQTVVVWDEDFAVSTAKAEAVAQALQMAECVAKVETLNTLDAWVGTLPGQTTANVRRPLLHSHNLAHLLPLSTPWPGPTWNAHLNGPPLLTTVGSWGMPFALDTYDGDVGMAYIAGPIGCHAKGTMILMADGTCKVIEDIVVGDAVMGPDSQPRHVHELHRGQDMLMEIRPVKGEPFVVNGDHILSLQRTPDGKSSLEGTVVNLSVREWLQRSRTFQGLHKLYRTGVDFPPGPPLPIPPYLLGVLLGDGGLQSTPIICNPDPEIYEAVVAFAGPCGYKVSEVYMNSTGCPHYRLIHPLGLRRPRAMRNPITVALEQLHLRGCHSETKFVPVIYKTASQQDRLDILAGLLDTDGSLTGPGGYDYISQSSSLAQDVCFIARSLGLAAYTHPCEKYCQTGGGGTYYRVSLSGDTDVIPCRVKRKQAAPRLQKKSVLMTGFTVHPVGQGDYYGFTCDGDHLYLLGDFTVTHNSGKSTMLATMVSQWLKYPHAQVRIFDTGQSLRCMTYALGGQWYDVAAQIEQVGQGVQHLDDPGAQFWGSPWVPPDHPWQCFELEGILKTPTLIETVIAPLMQVLKDRLTGDPTLFVFDEGHLYLLHRAFARGIDDYLRGLRKKNGAVVFATQSIADAARSDLAPIISESSMTRLLLPNYHALEPDTAKIYQGWGLNQRQCQIIAGLTPKQDYYYQGREGHRVFQLALGPMALALAGVSQKPDLALMTQLYQGDAVPFTLAWLQAKGLHRQADALKSEMDL